MSAKEREQRWRTKPEVKVRLREKLRAKRLADPEKYKAYSRKSERKRKLKKYGLTEESYAKLLLDQNNVCAICLDEKSHTRDWHVDHDHTTGVVRGILCHHCNLMLGNARDNITIMKNGIAYLERVVNG